MKRNLIRIVSMLWLALAMMVPAGLNAQEASPVAEPRLGGDLEMAVTWLASQQLDNGAFAGFSGEADAGTTVDAVIALAAARNDGVDTGDSIDRAVKYLASEDVALVYQQVGVGQAAKLVLALLAVGEDPTDFATTNPLAIVQNGQSNETGIYGSGVFDHAYALLALSATGTEVPESSIEALVATQAENGGWAFDASTDPAAADSNTTAMVIQALVATGNGDHDMVQGGLEFLLTVISDNGAGYAPGAEADANSTGLVAQAYIATQGDATAMQSSLTAYQLPSGSYFYQVADPAENLFSTVQAIPAVAGQAFPVMPQAGATPAASPAATPIARLDAIAA